MKLFVIAALVAVATAGRLEHLERAYLPPYHGSNVGFGSPNNYGSLGANSAFPSATSNQYLPPDHGPSASGAPEFAGSLQGFGPQTFPNQQYNIPSTQYGVPQVANTFGVPSYQTQFLQQSAAANRQYLAPTSSFQNPPQQAFDEQTGYHY